MTTGSRANRWLLHLWGVGTTSIALGTAAELRDPGSTLALIRGVCLSTRQVYAMYAKNALLAIIVTRVAGIGRIPRFGTIITAFLREVRAHAMVDMFVIAGANMLFGRQLALAQRGDFDCL